MQSPPSGIAREQLQDPNLQIFHHAPVLIVISAREPSHWPVEDCSLAVENLMLAAYAAGLGTCWIGLARDWLATPAGEECSSFGRNASRSRLILGHPKSAAAPVPRKVPDVSWIG
ncbi:MAG: nitroreductase family protein [Methyloceanibacter sp.]